MDTLLVGGCLRGVQGLIAAAPTILTGLFIAAIFRYYLRANGIRKLFGGGTWWSLPISWLIGMLMPVCSIGVLPVLREMKRARVPAGALTAFALSAPLFNPLSLLYGLTLSRPIVICGFAIASLLVVTLLGWLWDWLEGKVDQDRQEPESTAIGLSRLGMCCTYVGRELVGKGGGLMFLGVTGIVLLGAFLPHGALQTSVEQLDPLAPVTMTLVAIPVYATPMLTMSQLGMMFAHGNSAGAAFCLLIFGSGVNVATILWIGKSYGWKRCGVWLVSLIAIVLAIAYGIERPLIPPGVEPAGHTHAFDVYTNPFSTGMSFEQIQSVLAKSLGIAEAIGTVILVLAILFGLLCHRFRWGVELVEPSSGNEAPALAKFDRIVAPGWVAMVSLVGLISFSIVGCYAFYPSSRECLEEIRIARGETLAAARSGDTKHALYWLEVWDDWSRKLEVGTFIRRGELRPFQRQQTQLLRKKLELLEHELEHDPYEQPEVDKVSNELMRTSARIKTSFEE